MSAEIWNRFFNKVSESPEFRRELVELALRHGIDFSEGELSEEELGGLAGGTDELTALQLQTLLQRQQQVVQTISNISKMMHDTSKTIISNLK